MKFKIKQEIFDKFPDLEVGIVTGRGLEIKKQSEKLLPIIEENTRKLSERIGDSTLSDFVNISAWRETYRKFGVSPKKYKPTAEAFLKRILKGHPFPNINAAVDAYLVAELLYMLPIGGYDLDSVSGDIVLRISKGEEEFLSIGCSDKEYTAAGEIVYSDDNIVLTRNWNYRDSHHTRITEDSKGIVLACEAALGDIDGKDVKQTVDKIIQYESLVCGGRYTAHFLDRLCPEAEL
ncbi:MAG: hypothetical protein GY765_16960 [bacterium]|nr:hypothetical protein [bacterium]